MRAPVLALLLLPMAGGCAALSDCRTLAFWSHLPEVTPSEPVSVHVELRNCTSSTMTLPAHECRTEDAFLPRLLLFGELYWLDRNETAVPPDWPCFAGWPEPQPISLAPGSSASANVVWDGRYRNATEEAPTRAPPGRYSLVAKAAGETAISTVEVPR